MNSYLTPSHFRNFITIVVTVLSTLLPVSGGSEKPNILVLFADDISLSSLGCYGSENPHTSPNIDKLATQGLRFERMYVSEAVCAPARAELYTGLYPQTSGVYRNHTAAKKGTKSVAHYLADLGYRVGIAGKVHVQPKSSYPFQYIKGLTKDCNASNLDVGNWDGIKNFMTKKPASDEPFCLFVCSSHAHAPWDSGDNSRWDLATLKLPPHLADTKETRHFFRNYLAEVRLFDDQVGIAMDFLKSSGLEDNTILIVLDENGAGMPGGKWTCYEWGCHSAFVVRWPGKITPNQTTAAVAMYCDILPTMIEAAGGEIPKIIDGRSLMPIFTDPSKAHRDYAYLTYDVVSKANSKEGKFPIRAITNGKHKLIFNNNPELVHYAATINGFENGYVDKRFPDSRHPRLMYKSWIEAAKTNSDIDQFIYRHRKRPKFELYNLVEDQWEMNNLAGKPEYSELQKELTEKLMSHLEAENHLPK